jgi:hypothetical protein
MERQQAKTTTYSSQQCHQSLDCLASSHRWTFQNVTESALDARVLLDIRDQLDDVEIAAKTDLAKTLSEDRSQK